MNRDIAKLLIKRESSARQQVAAQLREMILSGKAAEGSKLPSSHDLAAQWKVAYSSVHAALTILTKEGLLQRTRKLGTFVATRAKQVSRVGIYQWHDATHRPAEAFQRTLIRLLISRLQKQGIAADILTDPRPSGKDRTRPWTELVQLAADRRIQALLIPGSAWHERAWISRLPIPAVEFTAESIRNRIAIAPEQCARLAVAELARMGCKSVGMISPLNPDWRGGHRWPDGRQAFHDAAAELGLAQADCWFPHPRDLADDADLSLPEENTEHYGYEMMIHLMEMPHRPDGVYIEYDGSARGAITAVLKKRLTVPDDVKLVLYRNLEIDYLCPLPAAFVDVSVAKIADAMIELMHSQLRGDETAPVNVNPSLTPAGDHRKTVRSLRRSARAIVPAT